MLRCIRGAVHDARPHSIDTPSVDAKLGVQALGVTAPDLPPVPGKAANLGRDDEYVRLVLDNHSAHLSKETRAFLATRPGRFEYVHTPKHGSWLNLIECVCAKTARTFQRHIRVRSLNELKARIGQGIGEMNAAPVVFRWNKSGLVQT